MYVIRVTKDGKPLWVTDEEDRDVIVLTHFREYAKTFATELDAKVDKCYVPDRLNPVIEQV